MVERWWRSHPELDDASLNMLTRHHWRGQSVPDYINTLLPAELKFADKNLVDHPCDTLVLLVGYSPEPLLQAVSVFQPTRIVLLVNEWYGKRSSGSDWKTGRDHGNEFRQYIQEHLARSLSRKPSTVTVIEVADQPDAVFRVLCDNVLHKVARGGGNVRPEDVVVDITGAKKSMVAGAFLFAAYADIPIAYVDFDDYDEVARRPIGFTCRIDLLPNPYERFSLRDWERVRQLYERYHFRDAAETLSSLVTVMRRLYEEAEANEQERETRAPFRIAHIEAAEKLLNVLRVYQMWDDGDHHSAEMLLNDPEYPVPDGFRPPVVVERLGSRWPFAQLNALVSEAARDLIEGHDELKRTIFTANQLLLPYARDELAKIDRLIEYNEDYRSALLRAAGLEEFLLKARWVRLWSKGWVGIWKWQLGRPESYLADCQSLDQGPVLYSKLIMHNDADHMRWTLQSGAVPTDHRASGTPYLDLREGYRARTISLAPRLSAYENSSQLAKENRTVSKLRNAAVHTFLYVPKTIAADVVQLVRANLEDFETNWTELGLDKVVLIDILDTKRLCWADLCHLCGLDFLPFPSRSASQSEEAT